MATPGTVLAKITPDELVERVANGESPIKIADELGVTSAAVYYHLVEHPGYKPARKVGMTIRLDKAENSIIEAQDQLSVSRGREVFRAVAWRAEREHPDLWGVSTKLTGADGGPLQVQIVRFGQTIEGETVSSTAPCDATTPVLPFIPKT